MLKSKSPDLFGEFSLQRKPQVKTVKLHHESALPGEEIVDEDVKEVCESVYRRLMRKDLGMVAPGTAESGGVLGP